MPKVLERPNKQQEQIYTRIARPMYEKAKENLKGHIGIKDIFQISSLHPKHL